MVRRSRQVTPSQHDPMYGWALDGHGRPIPIAAAARGAHGYSCPICGGPMIARRGDVKQHHFAHETIYQCTPEKVAMAIAGQWLVLQLGRRMVLGQPCRVNWQIDNERYAADLLKGISAIVEGMKTQYGIADIALVDGKDQIRTVLSISAPPDELALTRFASNGVATIILPVDRFRSGHLTLTDVLENSQVGGGWWLLGEGGEPGTPIANPETLRHILKNIVDHPPFQFWSKLVSVGQHKHVLRVGEQLLWLPQEIWQTTVGGTLNRLANDLVITVQEWPQPDDSIVVLFYIKRNDDCAVAIRRFQRGEHVHATLSTAYRMKRTTAEDVARLLAMG